MSVTGVFLWVTRSDGANLSVDGDFCRCMFFCFRCEGFFVDGGCFLSVARVQASVGGSKTSVCRSVTQEDRLQRCIHFQGFSKAKP